MTIPVTPIAALTPYTCGLACLESCFQDFGIPFTQCDMLKDCFHILEIKDPHRRHEYGSTSSDKIEAICQFRGVTHNRFQDYRQNLVEQVFNNSLSSNEAITINWIIMNEPSSIIRAHSRTLLYKILVTNHTN